MFHLAQFAFGADGLVGFLDARVLRIPNGSLMSILVVSGASERIQVSLYGSLGKWLQMGKYGLTGGKGLIHKSTNNSNN